MKLLRAHHSHHHHRETAPAAVWLAGNTKLHLSARWRGMCQRAFCFWGDEMELDFDKENGLIPAIVQDHVNGEVLMLGFMNAEALAMTQETGFVTFYRSEERRVG